MDPVGSFLVQFSLLWLGVVFWNGSWEEVCAPVKPPVQALSLDIIQPSQPFLQGSRTGIFTWHLARCWDFFFPHN